MVSSSHSVVLGHQKKPPKNSAALFSAPLLFREASPFPRYLSLPHSPFRLSPLFGGVSGYMSMEGG